MIKTRRMLLVFLLIVLQSALAITLGVVALSKASQKNVPSNVYVDELKLGGMSYEEAENKIKVDYAETAKHAAIKLDTGEGKIFEIPFSDIDANVDASSTIQYIKGTLGLKDIPGLLNSFFGQSKTKILPAIKFNDGKLRKQLLKLAESINIASSDAAIAYKDGLIEKKAETVGMSMDIANTADAIKKQLQENPWKVVKLDRNSNYEFKKDIPAVKLKDYDDIQQVFAIYSTSILSSELKESIGFAVDAINGVVISENSGSGSDSNVFSFIERLKAGNSSFENDNEGYDQVASTLYAALLSAGIPADTITRMPHELTADYIEPGLDAWISGNAGDLKFSNPFKDKIALFARIEGENVTVAVAGNMDDYKGKQELKTEVTQKFAPPAYYVENGNLKKGEKVVVNPGKEGIMVNVYRNGELIGTDKYEAEKEIIQIGPGTGIQNSNDK